MQTVIAQPLQRTYRIQSIDLLRGLVMVIMALDHVRDFFHWSAQMYNPLDFSHTSTPIFLTRWITHFCAPIFVFLAGTSAWLTGVRKGKKALSKFLLTRGLWLLFIEVVVINFAFSFDWKFSVIGLQTIWALGISMIALSFLIYLPKGIILIIGLLIWKFSTSGLQTIWSIGIGLIVLAFLIFLPKRIILIIGLAIIFFHNRLDNFHVEGNGFQALIWSMLHEPKFFPYHPFQIFVLYPVLPWIGVMAAGYCFGELYTAFDAEKRKKILIMIGSVCILLFIIIRATNLYGDASKWSHQATPVFTVLSFINVTKYPPSLLYILITIGGAILFLAFTKKPLNKFENIIMTYGKVPMFYYILHFYIIHITSIIAASLSGYSLDKILKGGPVNPLQGFGFPLWGVYIVWLSIVAILYPLCKRYAKYKFNHPEKWWLSYL